MDAPTPESVRAILAPFDARHQKIVAGLFMRMIEHPARVREQEWVAEQLTEMTVLAGGFDAESPDQAIGAVRTFLQAHAEELMTATLTLFQRVGLDMAPRVEEGFTYDDAMRHALTYMPSIGEPEGDEAGEPEAGAE